MWAVGTRLTTEDNASAFSESYGRPAKVGGAIVLVPKMSFTRADLEQEFSQTGRRYDGGIMR